MKRQKLPAIYRDVAHALADLPIETAWWGTAAELTLYIERARKMRQWRWVQRLTALLPSEINAWLWRPHMTRLLNALTKLEEAKIVDSQTAFRGSYGPNPPKEYRLTWRGAVYVKHLFAVQPACLVWLYKQTPKYAGA